MTKGLQDLRVASCLLQHTLFLSQSMQLCQQSAEKALKGCIFAHSGFSFSWKRLHCLTTLSNNSQFTSNSQIKSLADELEKIGIKHVKNKVPISLSVRSRYYSFYGFKLVKESNPQDVFTGDLAEKGFELAEKIVFHCISILENEKERVESILQS